MTWLKSAYDKVDEMIKQRDCVHFWLVSVAYYTTESFHVLTCKHCGKELLQPRAAAVK